MESIETTISRYKELYNLCKEPAKRERLKTEISKLQSKARQPLADSIINYSELLPSNIDKYEFNERAAIIEFDGNKPRHEAEKQAYQELKEYYNF